MHIDRHIYNLHIHNSYTHTIFINACMNTHTHTHIYIYIYIYILYTHSLIHKIYIGTQLFSQGCQRFP